MSPLVVVVIQARMGSTRLPGKVMAEIAGRTMLDRVVTRVSRAGLVDEVVVATTTLEQDDEIDQHAQDLSVRVVRGDSIDVLSRYVLAARESHAEVVVRVTADCPFIDAGIVDDAVTALVSLEGRVDYASNTLEPRSFPRGLDVEAMTLRALLEADRSDKDPGTREHVTPFIRDSGRYRCVGVSNPVDLSRIRWTVDTTEDLALARCMAEHFDGATEPTWHELLEAWNAHPEWHSINAHIEQKIVMPEGQDDANQS